MNRSIFKFVPVLLLIISVVSFNNNAQATGEWTPPDTLNPNVNPLEISAGRTYSDIGIYDTFIVLNEGPQTSLQVYNVETESPGCVLAQESTISGFDGQLFGSAHRIVATRFNNFSTNAKFYSSVVDDFKLKLLESVDGGKTWNIILVDDSTRYGSSDVAVDNYNPRVIHAGGCDFDNNRYRIFSNDTFNPKVFNLSWEVPNVNCALTNRVTRSTFNVFHDHAYVVYGRLIDPNRQENRVHTALGDFLLGEDDTALAEGGVIEIGQPTELANGYIVTPIENREGDCMKVAGSDVRNLGNDPVFQRVGDAPDVPFYGVSINETRPGVASILYSGGNHFELFTRNKEFKMVNTNGNVQNNTGPVAWSFIENRGLGPVQTIINPIFLRDGQRVQSYRAAYRGESLDCGEFIVKVPTIPTLSEWGLIALSGVLMLSGAFYLRRKKPVG